MFTTKAVDSERLTAVLREDAVADAVLVRGGGDGGPGGVGVGSPEPGKRACPPGRGRRRGSWPAARRPWCRRGFLRDDVARHLASPAVPPIPRDRALVLMPRTWPKRLWGRLTAWTTGRKRR